MAVILPIAVAVVRAVATGWFPVGDNALLAVRAADVGTQHHPLLGSWTSASLALGENVSNPGPLFYDLLAPFMWTIGNAFGIGAATAIGVGTVNAAFALGTALVGDRMGGWRVERWMLLLVAAITWSMGSELLIDIWQPHALLLPFTCLLVLTTAVLAGDLRLLPWWLGVLSLVVQTHVAYVYLGIALTALVAFAIVRRVRLGAVVRATSWRRELTDLLRHRVVLVSAAVVALAWSQPIVEQLAGPGEGNLSRLATNAGGGELTVGAGASVKIVAAVTALPPWWTRFGYEDAVPSTPLTPTPDGPRLFIDGLPGAVPAVIGLGVVVAVLTGLGLVLRRPAQRTVRAAVVVALTGIAVAVAGLTIQTVGFTGLGNHQVRWIFAFAAFVHVVIAWGVVELVAARRVGATRSGGPPAAHVAVQAVPAVLVVALVVANLPFHAHDLGPTADRASRRTLEPIFDDLAGFDPAGAVRYDTTGIRVFEPYSWALLMRFRELGVEFRFVDEIDIRQYGESRRADGTEVGTVFQRERADALLYDGPGCTLSIRSALDAEPEQRIDALIADAAADLTEPRIIDTAGLPDDVALLLRAAQAGDSDSAFRFVAQGLVPVLVDEGRVVPTVPLREAAAANAEIIERVNTTVRVIAEPAGLC
jgi:hypothetical protein